MLDQTKTPLLDAVLRYAESGVARFHMPGHKGGRAVHERLAAALGPRTLAMDATGVLGLDDLHQPGGVIAAAQDLAAEAFGADHTFFLVNGTSAGVQAMLLAACGPGEEIIVGRNLHKSAQAGLVHSGARPVYLRPEVEGSSSMGLGVTPEAVAEAIRQHPGARAVLLVNPNYHGVTSELQAIAALAHDAGMMLLVDEAHGAHFRFHSAFPQPALDAGADMCSHGIHKVLGGLTQASMLHLKGSRPDPGRVHRILQTLQSTSASYLLLASLDAARQDAVLRGPAQLQGPLELARRLRRELQELAPLATFGPELVGRPGCAGLDELKVTVHTGGLGVTGQRVEEWLRYRWNIQVEMSDLSSVLFMLGPGTRPEDLDRLLAALQHLVGDGRQDAAGVGPRPGWTAAGLGVSARLDVAGTPSTLPPLPPQELSPREAFYLPARAVPLSAARGAVSADLVTCYPPGIPILCPGERVTAEVMAYLELIARSGLRVSGPADPSLRTLQIL
ncbi:MAG: aminotransferase class I/II-fold pyridoxal phosphate-dependent enzyme [Symbiobacteriia bacterium]